MPAPNYSDVIEKNMLGHIKYRDAIRNGEVVVVNDDGTYDVKIALSDKIYPSIETLTYEMKFAVGEIAVLSFEYGNKGLPKIMGHGKKIAQDPVDVEVNNSGGTTVDTLDAHAITQMTAYLEGRITIIGMGNCTKRGFYYGTSAAYGFDTSIVGEAAKYENYEEDTPGATVGEVKLDEQSGFSFTTTSAHNIDNVKVYFKLAGGTPEYDLKVDLYLADAGHEPTGNSLANGGISKSSITSTWAKVTIPISRYTLSDAIEYVIMFHSSGTSHNNRYYLSYTDIGEHNYSGGMTVRSNDGGSTFIANESYDVVFFEVWGHDGTTNGTGSFVSGTYSIQITGLSANTTYHFQAYALDADGITQTGADNTFVTPPWS